MVSIKELFIFTPFNLIISGVTNTGKTHFALNLLETIYRGRFDNIVLFCPTFDYNETYNRKWIFKDNNFFVLDPNLVRTNLNALIFICTEIFKGSNTLFIIDDCANLHDVKKKATELCNLAFSGRHYQISTWIIIQKFNSLVKDMRENTRMLVLFFNKDENAMRQAFEENAIVPHEYRNQIIEKLKNYPKAKVVLRLEYPYKFLLFK